MDYCGTDLHQDKTYVCILDDEGEVKHRLRKGDVVSIHGGTGFVYVGERPVVRA